MKRAGFKAAFAASLMAFAALPALADTHSWRGPHGNFSVGSNWNNNAAPSAGDDLTFYRAAANASTWQYATNDLSVTFAEIQFTAGKIDIAGNLTTGSGKNLRIATADAAKSPFAAVNKSSGNWTVGKDIYIGGSLTSHTNMTGVLTNKAGNITASSGRIYLGGNVTAEDLPNVTGTLVNVSGTVKTRDMVIGGRANNTKGRLEIRGGTVEITGWDKMVDNSYWVGVLLGGWGGANSSIYVAKEGTMKLSCDGANIVVLDGTTEIDVDGLLTLNNGSIWPTSAIKEQKRFYLRVGPEGRVEFRSIKGGTAGTRMVRLDGGTIVPNGAKGYETPLASLSLNVTDKGGTIEVPSGKSLYTGVWVSSASSAKSSRLIKTGAGTLTINNYFRPAGGLDVREGTIAIQHNTGSFVSFDYPLALSGTATVTSGALAFGSGSSLSFDCKSKTSKPTMTVSTSFTRDAEVPITFNTAEPFAFDDTYTLISGGKITSTNNFKVASATADGTDITQGVYLAVESGNLVLKRKPYFMIKVR